MLRCGSLTLTDDVWFAIRDCGLHSMPYQAHTIGKGIAMYDFEDDRDVYAGDRWGAWLDDTRLPYVPPHTSHDALPGAREAWAADVAAGTWDDSLAEHAEIHAAYACADCREYADDYSAAMAERRVGA